MCWTETVSLSTSTVSRPRWLGDRLTAWRPSPSTDLGPQVLQLDLSQLRRGDRRPVETSEIQTGVFAGEACFGAFVSSNMWDLYIHIYIHIIYIYICTYMIIYVANHREATRKLILLLDLFRVYLVQEYCSWTQWPTPYDLPTKF